MNNSNDFICLSLSDDTLKIVHVKGQGPSAKVSFIFSKNLSGTSHVEIPRILESALKGLPTKSANILSISPPGITTTKNIEIPSTNQQEIHSIVNLQASRHTPFSREEIQIGFVNIGVYNNNFTKVLLAIANRVHLNDQVKLYERAGLKVKKVIFVPEAIGELFARSRMFRNAKGPVGIIDIDHKVTHFVIASKGRAITSRTIPVGRSDLAQDAEGAQTKLLDEFKKTIDSYLSEDIDQAPSTYFLTADDPLTKALQTAIQSNLSWDVQIAPYVDQVKVPKSILKQLASDYPNESFLDVIAAAAMFSETSINLIPEEVLLQKSIEDQRNQVFQTAILCVVLLCFVSSVFYLRLHFKNMYLKKMVKQYQDKRDQVNALQNQKGKNTLIKDYLESRMVSLDSIHQLYKMIPDDIYLTKINLEEGGNLNIQGVADTTSAVYKLNTTLQEANIFNEVDVTSNKPKKDRGKNAQSFAITLNIKSEAPDTLTIEQAKE